LEFAPNVLPWQVDLHLVAVRSHDHPVAADGQGTEVRRHIQFGVVEPLDGPRPPLLVVNHDDARRQPELTGAGRLAGEAEVDQEPATRAVDHEMVPLFETFGLGGGKHRGAEEVASGECRGHRSHLVFVDSVADDVAA
jgi:hypothetical protein